MFWTQAHIVNIYSRLNQSYLDLKTKVASDPSGELEGQFRGGDREHGCVEREWELTGEPDLDGLLPTPESLAVEVVDRVGITGVVVQPTEEVATFLLSDEANLNLVA